MLKQSPLSELSVSEARDIRKDINKRILGTGFSLSLPICVLFQSHPEIGLVTTPVSPAPTTPATPLGTTPPSSDGKPTASFVFLINIVLNLSG